MYHLYRRFYRFGLQSLFTRKDYTQCGSYDTGDSAESNRYRWIASGRSTTGDSSYSTQAPETSDFKVDAEARRAMYQVTLDQRSAALLAPQHIYAPRKVRHASSLLFLSQSLMQYPRLLCQP